MATERDDRSERFLIEEQARAYRLAYSYLKHPEDAMDAVQTAVCRAIEKGGRLREPEALRPWFYRILVNVCLDILRQRKRVVALPQLEEAGWEDPPPADDDLARQIDALPPAMGTAIKLRFFEELSLKEIALVTNSRVSTVKSRLYGALKKLRISMEGVEPE